jgi:cytidylate kinase
MIIAIDGTTASGKGTLAKRLAAHFGLPHLDTGLLYRAVGVKAAADGASLSDEEACAAIAGAIDLKDFREAELRTAEAGAYASRVAALGPVRKALLDLQVNFARQPGGAVLDGRDIGTVIAPDADVKFWIDASIPERARRRCRELELAGAPVPINDMILQLEERDARDRGRKDAPMAIAPGAVQIDTTEMTPDEVLKRALAAIPLAR